MEDEKELLKVTTTNKLVICHFYHPDFRRCSILDKHLESLAVKHFLTRFIKINVEKSPFCTSRLNIQTLPAVLSFIDGIVKDRVIGFDDLGNTDTFPTALLERRLAKTDVIKLVELKPKATSVMGFEKRSKGAGRYDSDSESD